ncbi:MAG TPA: hypothetical protein VFG44_02135, partial [Burkholderiales bacterium]|nr:hypothetical protein [Burkholderiales bacterium]
MKKKLPLAVAVLGLAGVFSSASATMLNDTYEGSNSHGYHDVIGPSTYDVDGMEASLSGNRLT